MELSTSASRRRPIPPVRTISTLAVFCGSSGADSGVGVEAVQYLADSMAAHRVGLVYGGAAVGIMGRLADRCLAFGLPVCGVIPAALYRNGLPHSGLTELIVADDMQSRKRAILERCDAAIALPGGFGTLDELFELLTWNQLGLTEIPSGILNVDGFFDPLLAQLDRAVEWGLLKHDSRRLLVSAADSEDLLVALGSWRGPREAKWIF